jgi:hypothetical protein
MIAPERVGLHDYPPLPWWERAGVRGEHTLSTPTHAPRRMHDCPESYMVQGSTSPIKGEDNPG